MMPEPYTHSPQCVKVEPREVVVRQILPMYNLTCSLKGLLMQTESDMYMYVCLKTPNATLVRTNSRNRKISTKARTQTIVESLKRVGIDSSSLVLIPTINGRFGSRVPLSLSSPSPAPISLTSACPSRSSSVHWAKNPPWGVPASIRAGHREGQALIACSSDMLGRSAPSHETWMSY